MITTTSANVIDELLADGFLPGPPHHLSAEVVMADLRSYADLQCETCGLCSRTVRPYQRGRDYRLAAECRRCGVAVEV